MEQLQNWPYITVELESHILETFELKLIEIRKHRKTPLNCPYNLFAQFVPSNYFLFPQRCTITHRKFANRFVRITRMQLENGIGDSSVDLRNGHFAIFPRNVTKLRFVSNKPLTKVQIKVESVIRYEPD